MDPLNPTCGLWVKFPYVRGKIAGLLPRRSDVHIRTMTWCTCSLNWPWRGRTTPIWKNSSRGTWVKVRTPPLIVVSRESPKPPLTPTRVEVKGWGNLRAMNEVKPEAGVPPLFYCKPVNDKGGLVMPLTTIIAVGVCCN